ncbi:pyridoxamine 5'-phosphate oxidase family protein [Ruegeria jejuensis]|uniref:pyridoxamine 5'-phosphate oxidase family protein n=1 Tax=Ruegeria jejuensis TaxID=3233338 RepID=UPI00355C0192
MPRAFSERTFTPAVRAHQERMGSAKTYAKFIEDGPQQGHLIGDAEKAFIEARDGFYQATVSETGWPYVQFRGGPEGFLKVLGPTTIGYADFTGNKQYISRGNLDGNDRIAMILMDYAIQRRLKILGRVAFSEGADTAASLFPDGTEATPERAAIIHVEALDWNCPSHITPRFTEAQLQPQLQRIGAEMEQLRVENAALKRALAQQGTTD